jgi:hypothetical protein
LYMCTVRIYYVIRSRIDTFFFYFFLKYDFTVVKFYDARSNIIMHGIGYARILIIIITAMFNVKMIYATSD